MDDEDALCQSSERALRRLGYEPTICNDAQSALALLDTPILPFDIILTDLAMPSMTGLEFSAEVLRRHPGARIILMSGFTGNLTVDSIRRLGLSDLATKPLNVSDLGEVLARNLSCGSKPGA